MAIGDNYITPEQFRDWFKLNKPDDGNDESIATVVAAISREIERHCGRQFNLAATATARVYNPTSRYSLVMDDVSTSAGFILKTDEDGDGVFETTWDPADYELTPRDGVQYGVDGWPYWIVKAVGSKRFRYSQRANVQITAQWGWAEVPDPVFQAAKLMAADSFEMRNARLGVAGSDSFGSIIRLRDNGIACQKLKTYRRGKVLVA